MRVINESDHPSPSMHPLAVKPGRLVVVTSHQNRTYVGLKGFVTQNHHLIIFDGSPHCREWDEAAYHRANIAVRYARPDEFIALAGDEE